MYEFSNDVYGLKGSK